MINVKATLDGCDAVVSCAERYFFVQTVHHLLMCEHESHRFVVLADTLQIGCSDNAVECLKKAGLLG